MKKVYYDREKAKGEKVAILIMGNSPTTARQIFEEFYLGRALGSCAPFICGYMNAYKKMRRSEKRYEGGEEVALRTLLDRYRDSVKNGGTK